MSSLTLLILALVSLLGRLYVRIRIQKKFTIDDGLLVFGNCCLVCALILHFTYMETMYMSLALSFGDIHMEIPPNLLQEVLIYHRVEVASLALSWTTIACVKFSFLALFKRLIDRMPPLISYWWIVVTFNVAVSCYGVAVPSITCPYFSSKKHRKPMILSQG